MAIGTLGVLTIAGTTAMVYTTSNLKTAKRSSSDELSFSLTEAGLANALAVLNKSSNNALDPDLLPSTEATASSAQYEGGTAKWYGVLDRSAAVWTITALGLYNNPTGSGAAQVRRKLTAKVPVTPVAPQDLAANNQAWQYMFATRTGNTCDMELSNQVAGASRLYTNGNLCISNNAGYTGEQLIVKGNLTVGNNSYVGATTSMATRVETHVGGTSGCKYHNDPWHNPCTDVDHVYSKKNPPNWVVGVNHSPTTIATPTLDMATWYENAIPGPSQPCTTTSGTPPVFDNNYPTRNNSVTPAFELTPSASSYTCRVGPASSPSGELSWDNTTKILTVKGVIYIDGSAKVTTTTAQYNGQATLYLSGSFVLNGKFCGGVSGSNCDFSAWNPNTEMLTIVADGNGGTINPGVDIADNAHFQGALYSSSSIALGHSSKSDGPMVGSTITTENFVQNDPFPWITTVPPGMPGNPNVYAQPNPPQMFAG